LQAGKIDEPSELAELLLEQLITDSKKIMKLLSTQQPKKLYLYLPPTWSYRLMEEVIRAKKSGRKMSDWLTQFFENNPEAPKNVVANISQKIANSVNELGPEFVDSFLRNSNLINEYEIYSSSLDYLQKVLQVEIIVEQPGSQNIYDPKGRAKNALPFRPSIYFE
jgi:leucyl-tRNA synthetase